RPSGTLQSPTTGSLEAMLRETEREEQIAAAAATARNAKRETTAPLPEPAAYAPAQKTAEQTSDVTNNQTTQVSVLQTSDAQVQPAAAKNGVAANTQPDSSMPQPKSASVAPPSDSSTPKMDVATAIKNVVSPSTDVSATSDSAKNNAVLTAPAEDLAPKSAVTDETPTVKAPLPSVIELRLTPAKSVLSVGEKLQLAIELNSEARLGLAVVMLRFDPNVLKVNSVTAGKMFTDAKTMPNIT